MILSQQLLLSDNQTITADAPSTNYIDFGQPGTPHQGVIPLERDMGKGEPVCFEVMVTEAFNNLTSLRVDLEIDNDDTFASAEVVESHTFFLANLVPGANLPNMYLPVGTNKRYLRLNYTVVGAAPTSGAVLAGISAGRQTNT